MSAKKKAAKKRPVALTSICIFLWVVGILGILGAIVMLIGGGGAFKMIPGVGGFVGSFLIAIGILVLIISIVLLLITYYLWLMKNWARFVIIIFSIIGLFAYPYVTIVSAVLLYFLIFDKNVKKAF